MENMIHYAKEIGLYNGILETEKTTIARRKRIRSEKEIAMETRKEKDAHGIKFK
jgi:hypothetical protein